MLEVLRYFYWTLATGKILQCLLLLLCESSPANYETKEDGSNGDKHRRRRVEMVPSVQVMIRIVEYLLGQEHELSQIPRKELRDITDPWLQTYAEKYGHPSERSDSGRRKRYTSIYEAKRDFFKELCQESTGIHVDLTNIAVPFLNYPLGFVSLTNFSIFLMSLPVLLIREFCLTRTMQAPQILLCKIAASKTITDVYVMACKDGIDFETTIHRYPLTADLFNNTQFHPLVGRAACPIYKREVVFPRNEKQHLMDFDFDFIRIPGGQAILRQKHTALIWNLWEDILLAHYIMAMLSLMLVHNHGLIQTVQTLAPAATVFYTIRTLVDYWFRIPHDPRHHYSL